jgi:predicted metal-dependent hydrolase
MTESDAHEIRTVALDDHPLSEIAVVVRRNPRARHVRLHVEAGGEVRASIPKRFALWRLDAIVRDRAEWLNEAVTAARLTARSTEIDLLAGDPVRLLGTWYRTEVVEVTKRSRCVFMDDRLVIHVKPGHDPYDVLETWYRNEARKTIVERVEHYAAAFGFEYRALSIRDQRTRWGSCSVEGNLNFNWRLVLAPLWVLDSIVVHELCHLTHMDHSDAFWSLLDQLYPRHREANEWLAKHGPALSIVRATSTPTRPGKPVSLF